MNQQESPGSAREQMRNSRQGSAAMRGRSNRQSVDEQNPRAGVFKIYGPNGGTTNRESVQHNTIRKVVDPKKTHQRPQSTANASSLLNKSVS